MNIKNNARENNKIFLKLNLLYKKSDYHYEAIQDAEGNWIKDKESAALTGMSDETGVVLFSNLQLGKQYIAEEVQAPDGYEIEESSKNILLTAVPDADDTTITEVINAKEQVQKP